MGINDPKGSLTPDPERFTYDNLVILKRRTASADFTEEIYDKAFEHAVHGHEQAYFTLTQEAVYRESLGSKTYNFAPHSIIWRPAGISHADGMASDNGKAFSFFIKDELSQRLSDYARLPAEFSETNSYLLHLANRVRYEFYNWDSISDLLTEGLVLEMLGYAVRQEQSQIKQAPPWLARSFDRLESEFLESHTNQELAREAGVHPVHFARTFRKFYGKSAGRYLKEKRIQLAIGLMEQDISLTEIAYTCGFSDQSQFTRAFKQIAGVTPAAYRRR